MPQALVSRVRSMDLRKASVFRPLCCIWKAQIVDVALAIQVYICRLPQQTAGVFSDKMLMQAACSKFCHQASLCNSGYRLIAGESKDKRLAQLYLLRF